jgi:transcriptional regulator with XRE-family HTH domain
MNFAGLQSILLAHLLQRLHNGEWSERRLARFVGVSQPHMHNVLSGVRLLTAGMADEILSRLGIDLLALVGRDELERALGEAMTDGGVWRAVALAEGMLGPLAPWPNLDSRADTLTLEARCLRPGGRPVLVRLGADAEIGVSQSAGWLALLDRGEQGPAGSCGDGWYALRWKGRGFIRQMRATVDGLRLCGQMSLLSDNEDCPAWVAEPRGVVQARVLWMGPDPRSARRLDQSGFLLRAATSR